jgi:hypothetical protein
VACLLLAPFLFLPPGWLRNLLASRQPRIREENAAAFCLDSIKFLRRVWWQKKEREYTYERVHAGHIKTGIRLE